MDLPDYIKNMPITIADEEFLLPYLTHWNKLNAYLQHADLSEVVKLLKLELLAKEPRNDIIKRLHSKLCKINNKEERESLNMWVKWRANRRKESNE